MWARVESKKRRIKKKGKRKTWDGGDAPNHDAGRFRLLDGESDTCLHQGRWLVGRARITCCIGTWYTALWASPFPLAVTPHPSITAWCDTWTAAMKCSCLAYRLDCPLCWCQKCNLHHPKAYLEKLNAFGRHWMILVKG